MTSVTGGSWAASADASRSKNTCSDRPPPRGGGSALGTATPDLRSAATT